MTTYYISREDYQKIIFATELKENVTVLTDEFEFKKDKSYYKFETDVNFAVYKLQSLNSAKYSVPALIIKDLNIPIAFHVIALEIGAFVYAGRQPSTLPKSRSVKRFQNHIKEGNVKNGCLIKYHCIRTVDDELHDFFYTINVNFIARVLKIQRILYVDGAIESCSYPLDDIDDAEFRLQDVEAALITFEDLIIQESDEMLSCDLAGFY